MAFVMLSNPAISALSLYASLLACVLAGVAFAPQQVRRDKRAIVAVVVIVLAAIGIRASAAVIPDICQDPNLPEWMWWLYGCFWPY